MKEWKNERMNKTIQQLANQLFYHSINQSRNESMYLKHHLIIRPMIHSMHQSLNELTKLENGIKNESLSFIQWMNERTNNGMNE